MTELRPDRNSRSYTTLAAAIVMAAVIVAAAIFAASAYSATVTRTLPETTTQTSTITTTETSTLTVPITENFSLLAQCSHAQAPTSIGALFGEVAAGTSTPAIICVQYYYFNSTAAPLTLSLPDGLTIQAVQPNRSFDGSPNFTLGVSQTQLVIGGPGSENEGAIVAYAVTAKAGASGTYELDISGAFSMLTTQEPVQCGFYGELVAGNGQPNYAGEGVFNGCLTYHMTNTSGSPTIPGIQYPIMSGELYFRVVGVNNSTQ